MNPHRKWIAALGCILLAVAVATSQEKKEAPRTGVGVKLDVLTLRDGLPRFGTSIAFPVGSGFDVVCLGRTEGQSRWLPHNAIEITLKFTGLDNAKRTETIVLEGFEPKTLVLHDDPANGRREMLRLIPVSGRVVEGLQYYP